MDAKQYFDRVIKTYLVGDIQALLGWNVDKAGPLLMLTCNAIDALGGVVCGFSEKNGTRIKHIVSKYMGLSNHADFIYHLVRCSIDHEGVVPGIDYSKDESNDPSFPFTRSAVNGRICLHVCTLAQLFLNAVETVEKEEPTSILHFPIITEIEALNRQGSLNSIAFDSKCTTSGQGPAGRSSTVIHLDPSLSSIKGN